MILSLKEKRQLVPAVAERRAAELVRGNDYLSHDGRQLEEAYVRARSPTRGNADFAGGINERRCAVGKTPVTPTIFFLDYIITRVLNEVVCWPGSNNEEVGVLAAVPDVYTAHKRQGENQVPRCKPATRSHSVSSRIRRAGTSCRS
ncbi:hypothetical protein HN011_000693 [Eciton burchellii]|nr:hypothetical protein HN011_000693 [Eciton burchellii]